MEKTNAGYYLYIRKAHQGLSHKWLLVKGYKNKISAYKDKEKLDKIFDGSFAVFITKYVGDYYG